MWTLENKGREAAQMDAPEGAEIPTYSLPGAEGPRLPLQTPPRNVIPVSVIPTNLMI